MNFISEPILHTAKNGFESSERVKSSGMITRKTLLICGVLSSLLYVVMNVVVPLQSETYNWVTQTISELSAIGAPTRQLWITLAIFYGLLLIAYGIGIWLSAETSWPLRVAGAMFIMQGAIGFFWPPMHQREVLAAGGGTATDTMHIVFTMMWAFLAIVGITLGAVAFGKRFQAFSLAIILILIVFGVWAGLESPRIEANLSTPWIGVVERINIGAFMLWVVFLAIALLRRGETMRH